MTVFVVALRLPFTVDLKHPVSNRRGSFQPRDTRGQGQSSKATAETPTLLLSGLPITDSALLQTPERNDDEDFFARGSVGSPSRSPSEVDKDESRKSSDSSLPPVLTDEVGSSRQQEPSGSKRILPGTATAADWTVMPDGKGNFGLKNAVKAARKSGKIQDVSWVGTLGIPTDKLDAQKRTDIQDQLELDYDCLTVFCKDSDFEGHYTNYCKQILWPLFHYQIPDNPKSKAYQDHSWKYYVTVNQAFADKVVKNWKSGDTVWIHDYHLLLVPSMIRKKLPDAKIGFFLHVAFPSSEVFRCLADRLDLLNGLLGANLIGFQIPEYCNHFLQTCHRLLCVEATKEGIQLEDRFVNVINTPIGIDPSTLSDEREHPSIAKWLRLMKERYRDKRLIVARDKLDHIRGIRQKVLAYELFLNKFPAWRDKVVMIQVCTSTTKQAELNAAISDVANRVNASFATLAHQPLVILNQDISHHQYLALFAVADALMITSLREGMSLTSHEFIFSQDGIIPGSKNHGPVILSEFTGSSSIFGGCDLSVNPWNARQCAEAIKTALEMDTPEKDRRWQKLHDCVMQQTGEAWMTKSIDELERVSVEQRKQDLISIPRLSVKSLGEKYQNTSRRLFILDYEGTLAVWGSVSNTVLTSPQRTLDVLTELVDDPKNIVYVVSGRKPEEIDQLLHRVPSIGLVAENGCFLKEFGADEWIQLADQEQVSSAMKSVRSILSYYCERIPGSWLEELHCSIILHYGDADDFSHGERQAGECASQINDACAEQHVHAVPTNGAIVVEHTDWNKHTAATTIFELLGKKEIEGVRTEPVDFLMVAGDGREDEVVYHWANNLYKQNIVGEVFTVSVGLRHTEANAIITQGVTGLLSTLLKLAALSRPRSSDETIR